MTKITTTPRRVYAIHHIASGTTRLVRASNAATALRHVVRSDYSAEVASQDDLIELLTSGTRVEDAGTEDEPAPVAAPAPAPAPVKPQEPDLFEDAPAAAGPAPAADHVEELLAMVQEVAAAPLGEPAAPLALDACAPAGVEHARSESGAADAPAQPDDIGRQVRELAMLLGCERPDMAVETPQDLVDLLQQHGLNEFNGRGHDLCRLFWQHYYPTAATAHSNGTALAEAMASTAPALMLPAERVSHAYATGYRLGAAGNSRWSAEWRVANDAERDGMSDSESMETHDAMISGTRAGTAAFVVKTQAGSEPKRQAPAAAERQVSGGKVSVKYRNAATGESWSGRGLRPRWLVLAMDEGKTLADFLVDGVAA